MQERSNGMPELANKDQCTGCTACVNICSQKCIQMQENEEGFSFPVIDVSSCISCGVCEQVCPILNEKKLNEVSVKAYSAYSMNELIRKDSSSGGVFSALALTVLKKGGIVYGAVYSEKGLVKHIGVEDVISLAKLRGAKYSQSRLGSIFRDVKRQLDSNRDVLFSGTPCQVAGLKSFLGKDYINLFCVDFVCHGVPSPMVWSRYIDYRSKIDNKGAYPKYINLRNKESGWSNFAYSVEIGYSDKKRYLCKNNDDPFINLFTKDYILRKSCSECHFKGFERFSDLTLGDFWGIWDIDPSMDDNKGTSLVLTNSKKGEKLFEFASSDLKYKQVTLDQAVQMNQSLINSSIHKRDRNKVLSEIRENGFQSISSLLNNVENNNSFLHTKIRKLVKKVLLQYYNRDN